MQEFDPHVLEEKPIPPPEEFSKKARVGSLDEYALTVCQEGNEGNPADLTSVRIVINGCEHSRTAQPRPL